MLVEIWSDEVCPRDYVGVKPLPRARAQRPGAAATPVELRCLRRPFNPDLPESGEDGRADPTRRCADPDRFDRKVAV